MGRLARVLLLVVVTSGSVGCLRPDLVPCGELSCPSGSTCVANSVCARADQLAACNGTADGEACTFGGGVGTCEVGVCTVTGCGNGVIDRAELCDGTLGMDVAAGQTCSADCMTIQVCGNGIVDPVERCDDGNTNPADGCDACEPTAWRATAAFGGAGAGAATAVALSPNAVALDRAGNLYIADTGNDRVRRIDAATSIITTVAGTGSPGYSGDDGEATSAQLFSPTGVAVDGLGNIYIADYWNFRVRRVDGETGIITTVAGTGVDGQNGDNVPATSAELYRPAAVAVDGLGNLYIADATNVRLVNASGIISTVSVGQAVAPTGVATDGLGNLYISDFNNARILRVDAGGTTLVARRGAEGIAVDGQGNIYLTGINSITRIDAMTNAVTTIAGTGTPGFSGDGGSAVAAELEKPTGVVTDRLGNIYVADTKNHRVRRVDTTGTITTVAGTGIATSSGDGGPPTSRPRLNYPTSVAIDKLGTMYIGFGQPPHPSCRRDRPDHHHGRRHRRLGFQW